MIKVKKERLFKQYASLERRSRKVEVNCEVYARIKEAIKNKDKDALFIIGQEHGLEPEEISWMISEGIKAYEEKDEAVRLFKEAHSESQAGPK